MPLGRAFARACLRRGLAHRVTSRAELDITDEAALRAALERFRPWAVINTAGYVRVEDAEREPAHCWRANTLGPEVLARVCAEGALPLLTFSSDLVFDGARRDAYRESDAPRPVNTYGRSKAAAEAAVLALHAGALVIRTSAFFWANDEYNFLTRAVRDLALGRTIRAYDGVTVSPTYVPDLIDASLDLLIDREVGLWHLTNQGQVTWYELACKACELAEAAVNLVHKTAAPPYLPAFTPLTSERALLLPPLEQALETYRRELTVTAGRGEASS